MVAMIACRRTQLKPGLLTRIDQSLREEERIGTSVSTPASNPHPGMNASTWPSAMTIIQITLSIGSISTSGQSNFKTVSALSTLTQLMSFPE